MKDALNIALVAIAVFVGYLLYDNSDSSPVRIHTEEDYQEQSLIRTDDYTTERSFEEYGDYDCTDFDSQSEAQDFFESEGGPEYDFHNLDRDGDGYACESLY